MRCALILCFRLAIARLQYDRKVPGFHDLPALPPPDVAAGQRVDGFEGEVAGDVLDLAGLDVVPLDLRPRLGIGKSSPVADQMASLKLHAGTRALLRTGFTPIRRVFCIPSAGDPLGWRGAAVAAVKPKVPRMDPTSETLETTTT